MPAKLFIDTEIPKSLDLDLSSELMNYSVALGRVSNNDPKSFLPLGSGTFVVKGGRFGILTAHHCLHSLDMNIRLGEVNRDTFVLAMRSGRVVLVKNEILGELPLGCPENNEYSVSGPDLTFIEIGEGPELSTLRAVAGFRNLDIDLEAAEKDFISENLPIALCGFPQVNYKTSLCAESISHHVKFMSYMSIMQEKHISANKGWDYIDAICNYEYSEGVPDTFKGMSGGGVWSVRLEHKTEADTWHVNKFCLVGVVFYESRLDKNRMSLRSHFFKSLYKTKW